MIVFKSNCIFFNFTRYICIYTEIIFLSVRRLARLSITYYAVTSHRALFSTQLPDNENIGGKGTFITAL